MEAWQGCPLATGIMSHCGERQQNMDPFVKPGFTSMQLIGGGGTAEVLYSRHKLNVGG